VCHSFADPECFAPAETGIMRGTRKTLSQARHFSLKCRPGCSFEGIRPLSFRSSLMAIEALAIVRREGKSDPATGNRSGSHRAGPQRVYRSSPEYSHG
jgi:hypothetical protein